MSILSVLRLTLKSANVDALVGRLSVYSEFSGIQELSEEGAGLWTPPVGFEILEFGTAAAQRFDDFCRQNPLQGDETTIDVYFEGASGDRAAVFQEQIENELRSSNLSCLAFAWRQLLPQDYLENYKKNCKAHSFSNFWVGPPWHTPDPSIDYKYFVEPGMAFGTGEHPTTQMCLQRLNELKTQGFSPRSFLDLGTGSGLLALHAQVLFPHAEAWASDLDPYCGEEFKKTYQLNKGQLGNVKTVFGPEAALNMLQKKIGSVDLLISNIYSEVLATLVDDARVLVSSEGYWIASGILEGASEKILLDALKDKFKTIGRWVQKTSDQEGWVSLLLK